MKLSRDDLKNIVKECLVEILSEGISSSAEQIRESKLTATARQPQQRTTSTHKSGIADKISFLPRGNDQQASRSNVIDKRTITAVTSDPILQEMLADTAKRGTPIVEESRASSSMHETSIALQGDIAAKQMLRSDPSDVFGEASSKWATLAFSEKKLGA